MHTQRQIPAPPTPTPSIPGCPCNPLNQPQRFQDSLFKRGLLGTQQGHRGELACLYLRGILDFHQAGLGLPLGIKKDCAASLRPFPWGSEHQLKPVPSRLHSCPVPDTGSGMLSISTWEACLGLALPQGRHTEAIAIRFHVSRQSMFHFWTAVFKIVNLMESRIT